MGLAGVRPHGLLEDPHPGASGSEGHLKWVLSSLGTIDPPHLHPQDWRSPWNFVGMWSLYTEHEKKSVGLNGNQFCGNKVIKISKRISSLKQQQELAAGRGGRVCSRTWGTGRDRQTPRGRFPQPPTPSAPAPPVPSPPALPGSPQAPTGVGRGHLLVFAVPRCLVLSGRPDE